MTGTSISWSRSLAGIGMFGTAVPGLMNRPLLQIMIVVRRGSVALSRVWRPPQDMPAAAMCSTSMRP